MATLCTANNPPSKDLHAVESESDDKIWKVNILEGESKSCQDLSSSLHCKKTFWPRKERKSNSNKKSYYWLASKERNFFFLFQNQWNRFVLLICAFQLLLFFQHSVTSFKSQIVTENQEIRFGCGFDDDELSWFFLLLFDLSSWIW